MQTYLYFNRFSTTVLLLFLDPIQKSPLRLIPRLIHLPWGVAAPQVSGDITDRCLMSSRNVFRSDPGAGSTRSGPVVGAEPPLVTGLCPATGRSQGAVCGVFPKVRNLTDGGSTLMTYPPLKGPSSYTTLAGWGVRGVRVSTT